MAFSQEKLWRASGLLALFSFIADLAGLLRDRILAAHFGASHALDVYYSAFKIPDLIFNLLVLGALSSAFIPVFIEHYRADQARAWRLAQNFITLAFSAVAVAAALIFLFANPLARLVAPGFTGADRVLLVQLMRLMLLSPVLFAISAVLGSILQSLERFLAYAIAPILYNTGIIIGALYFVPYFRISGRPEILGLGAGVVLGALMHLLLQAGAALKAGFRFRLIWDMADDGFNKIIRLMIPRTLGLGAYSIESAVTNAIASTLGAGSITVFNFANNIQFVPIAVLGVSVATAVFPRLSSHASSQEFEAFWSRLKEALGRTLMIVGSVAVLVFLFRELIIKIIFQTGAFRGGDVHATAQILGIFMFGVVAQSLIPIMSRAFYALQNTRTPVMISVLAIAVNISLALLFTFRFHFGIQGLAWAFAISGNLNFLLLYLLFRRRYSY